MVIPPTVITSSSAPTIDSELGCNDNLAAAFTAPSVPDGCGATGGGGCTDRRSITAPVVQDPTGGGGGGTCESEAGILGMPSQQSMLGPAGTPIRCGNATYSPSIGNIRMAFGAPCGGNLSPPVELTYNSLSTDSTSFGFGWNNSYSRWIEEVDSTTPLDSTLR